MFFASDLVSNSHEEAMKLVTPEIHVDADSDLANSDLHRILERADDFLNSGRNHFAISLLSRVVHRAPRHLEAWNKLGCAYGRLRQPDDAIKCFNKAISIDPRCGDSWSNRGSQYLKLKKFTEAAADFGQSVKCNPEDGTAWQSLGLAKLKLSEPQQAIDALRMATRVQPYNESHWLLLAKALRKVGLKKEAAKCSGIARTLNPMKPLTWILTGPTFKEASPPSIISAQTMNDLSSDSAPVTNLGVVLTSDRHLGRNRLDPAQQRLQTTWDAIQNPVAWIGVLVFAALLYIILGK